jgi:hypothetical protein
MACQIRTGPSTTLVLQPPRTYTRHVFSPVHPLIPLILASITSLSVIKQSHSYWTLPALRLWELGVTVFTCPVARTLRRIPARNGHWSVSLPRSSPLALFPVPTAPLDLRSLLLVVALRYRTSSPVATYVSTDSEIRETKPMLSSSHHATTRATGTSSIPSIVIGIAIPCRTSLATKICSLWSQDLRLSGRPLTIGEPAG